MTFFEILIGCLVALVILASAIIFAVLTPNLKGLTRHGIRGNGDHAHGHNDRFSGEGGGSDGGGD